MKQKEKSRLVLQWRKPEETNGIIKKYVLHFRDSDGVTKTYTLHSDVDKEYVTYEVTLPDVEAEYKIKVSKKKKNSVRQVLTGRPPCIRMIFHSRRLSHVDGNLLVRFWSKRRFLKRV